MEKKTKYKIGAGLIFVSVLGWIAYVNNKKKSSVNQLVNKKISSKFSNNNQKLLNELNPAAKQIFSNFIKDVEKKGFSVVINNTYRATSEQIELKKKDSRNATAGFSTHEYGIGLDMSLVKDGKWINKKSSLDTWNATGIPQLAKTKYKMRWGGDFKGYLDPVHFDLGNTYNTKDLYSQALKIYGTPAKFQGNKMKLVS